MFLGLIIHNPIRTHKLQFGFGHLFSNVLELIEIYLPEILCFHERYVIEKITVRSL